MKKTQAITQRRRGAKRRDHLSSRQMRRKAEREIRKQSTIRRIK
jgi:hypothetical protein|tara:strand:+ start:583 stop:714 length:132 start_codon:yes stop_codon:yes gene_type:complete